MGAAAHLSHKALLLHLAAELAQSLLELLRVFDDYLQALITPLMLLIAPVDATAGPSAWASRTRITEVRAGCAERGSTPGLPSWRLWHRCPEFRQSTGT